MPISVAVKMCLVAFGSCFWTNYIFVSIRVFEIPMNTLIKTERVIFSMELFSQPKQRGEECKKKGG